MNTFLQRVHHLDTLIFLWVHVTKRYPYRKSVRWLSRSGDGPVYAIIGLLLYLFEAPAATAFLLTGLIAYGLEVPLYLILKKAIKRDRPADKLDCYRAWITPSDKFSFPSGHTAAGFVFACLMMEFYGLIAIPFFIWASLIGVSRVLLGVHYPSDIAAGAVLGITCAMLASAVSVI